MRKSVKFYMLTAFMGLITFVLINIYSEKIEVVSKPIPPPPELANFHMGYAALMADAYWLRLLQDVDYCGASAIPFEDSLNPSGARRGPNRTPGCKKGWSFSMLNLILELDPRFHYAVQMGPMSLSVISDDIEGATIMFKKATELYPNDWILHYQAGYHFMSELEDYESAASYYDEASKLGAPRWLPLLVARLQTKAGKSWLARATLENFMKTVKDDPVLLKRTQNKLKALNDSD